MTQAVATLPYFIGTAFSMPEFWKMKLRALKVGKHTMSNQEQSEQENGGARGQKVQSPHDKLFRQTFSDKRKVEAFLKGALTESIASKLQFESLNQVKDSFIDEQLREHFADVVYTCKFGEEREITLTFLFEHKTWQPAFPHLQLLRYMLNIWEAEEKNRQQLRPILPIVVYHGRKAWDVKPFKRYFERDLYPKELERFLPTFEYGLVDLTAASREAIQGDFNLTSLRASFLVMKYMANPNVLELIPFILGELKQLLREKDGDGYYQIILLYLRNHEKAKNGRIMEAIDHTEWVAEKGSWAWEDQQKGKLEANQKIAERMLRKGYPVPEIAELTTLSEGEISKLKSALS